MWRLTVWGHVGRPVGDADSVWLCDVVLVCISTCGCMRPVQQCHRDSQRCLQDVHISATALWSTHRWHRHLAGKWEEFYWFVDGSVRFWLAHIWLYSNVIDLSMVYLKFWLVCLWLCKMWLVCDVSARSWLDCWRFWKIMVLLLGGAGTDECHCCICKLRSDWLLRPCSPSLSWLLHRWPHCLHRHSRSNYYWIFIRYHERIIRARLFHDCRFLYTARHFGW